MSVGALSRFTPEMLPSESWRHAYHALRVQPISSQAMADYAKLTAALELAGYDEVARASVVHVGDMLQDADLPESDHELFQILYTRELDTLRAQFDHISPSQFHDMTAAQRRALIREPLRDVAFIDSIAEAMMGEALRGDDGVHGEQLDALLRQARALLEQGRGDEAEVLLLMHEPELDRVRELPRWIRTRTAWHAMWRELGKHKYIARNLESPLHHKKTWRDEELAVLATWRCEQWLALEEPARALEQCQRALALYPERFRQQPSLSTQVDRLPDALLDASVRAAIELGKHQLATRYASWHATLSERERFHAMIFEAMLAQERDKEAVAFAQEFLDDRDLLVAVTHHARAHPEDEDAEARRVATWKLFEEDRDALYRLDRGPGLERQIARLLEILSFKEDEGARAGMTFEHLVDAIDRIPDEDEHLRGYVLLATLVDPDHAGRKGLLETIREKLEIYSTHRNANGVAALYSTDHAMFAWLITRSAKDAKLATLLFEQFENAADAGAVLGMIARDDALRALPETWRAEMSARLLDLPQLRSPAEYVTLGAQLMRLFDDRSAWEQVEAHIFARRRDAAVSAEQLRTLYATWFERKLALGADFSQIEAIIVRETLPRERDIMSAAIVDVMYERPWLDELISLDDLQPIESWRDGSSRSRLYEAKLAALRARRNDCERVGNMPTKTLRAFPPALPTLLTACREQLPAKTWHAWIETREADRARFARELLFALIYEP